MLLVHLAVTLAVGHGRCQEVCVENHEAVRQCELCQYVRTAVSTLGADSRFPATKARKAFYRQIAACSSSSISMDDHLVYLNYDKRVLKFYRLINGREERVQELLDCADASVGVWQIEVNHPLRDLARD